MTIDPTHTANPYRFQNLDEVGFWSRLLWFCAGADAQILVQCPNADRVKYQGLGGIVLASGGLAFLSGSYAFYTVFSPKTVASLSPDASLHWPSLGFAAIAGFVWALMIFNLERFIVSSSGKGDGTEKITFSELVGAFPRIIMSAIIGLTLSAPLEIRILEPEITQHLKLKQQQQEKNLNESRDAAFQQRKTELLGLMSENQRRRDAFDDAYEMRRMEIREKRKQLEDEAAGRLAGRKAGRGPVYQDTLRNLQMEESELEAKKERDEKRIKLLEAEIESWKKEIEQLEKTNEQEHQNNRNTAAQLDGLLERYKISHEIGGGVPWAIMLLLMCIELGPIFFKMMVTKGAYEALEMHYKLLVRAEAGIEEDAHVFTDSSGRHHYQPRYHAYESMIEERRRVLETERILADVAHTEYRRERSDEVRAFPSRFMTETPRRGAGSAVSESASARGTEPDHPAMERIMTGSRSALLTRSSLTEASTHTATLRERTAEPPYVEPTRASSERAAASRPMVAVSEPSTREPAAIETHESVAAAEDTSVSSEAVTNVEPSNEETGSATPETVSALGDTSDTHEPGVVEVVKDSTRSGDERSGVTL